MKQNAHEIGRKKTNPGQETIEILKGDEKKNRKWIFFVMEQESIFHPLTIIKTKIPMVIKNQRIHWSLGRHHCQAADLNKWVWCLSVQLTRVSF